MSSRQREATDGPPPAPLRRLWSKPDPDADHPDPVTLSEPTFDDAGLLRWGSTKY